MVILSLVALGVRVMFDPAVRVKVSVLLSATIVVLPTTTLLNAFWLTSAPSAMPFNLDLSDADISPADDVDALL